MDETTEMNHTNENTEERELKRRGAERQARIRRNKLEELKRAGKNPFAITKYDVTHSSEDVKNSYLEAEEPDPDSPVVSVAGRIMLKRIMGKASFFHIQDKSGLLQIYIKSDAVGGEAYQDFKTYDIGDIVGIRGTVFKTKTGEITVKAKEITLLSKSLQPLPEKRHGLRDLDTRYRQRYVDLIVNPEVRGVFEKRSQIIRGNPQLFGSLRIYGGRNAGTARHCRRRSGQTVLLRIIIRLISICIFVSRWSFI